MNDLWINLSIPKLEKAIITGGSSGIGTLRIIRGFLASMLGKKEGDIVLISSVSSKRAYRGGVIYAATKAAIDVIAETLRLETQPIIRVITVSPGVVDTNFLRISSMGIKYLKGLDGGFRAG